MRSRLAAPKKQITLRLHPTECAEIDALRGNASRNEWITDILQQARRDGQLSGVIAERLKEIEQRQERQLAAAIDQQLLVAQAERESMRGLIQPVLTASTKLEAEIRRLFEASSAPKVPASGLPRTGKILG